VRLRHGASEALVPEQPIIIKATERLGPPSLTYCAILCIARNVASLESLQGVPQVCQRHRSLLLLERSISRSLLTLVRSAGTGTAAVCSAGEHAAARPRAAAAAGLHQRRVPRLVYQYLGRMVGRLGLALHRPVIKNCFLNIFDDTQ
jgi:hypothetical protein